MHDKHRSEYSASRERFWSEIRKISSRIAITVGRTHFSNTAKEINVINSYPTAFPYGNGMVLHFYQQQESSTTKTVHKVINKGLKTYV